MKTKVLQKKTKFIVITGGVCSGLGKGVLISAIGTLLKNAGYTITIMKWDPYLNVDPGTISPIVHGEVFVTDDGAETDLDLGHYERMLEMNLTKESSVSAGQIFKEILDNERTGAFLGRDIQLVPHVVDAIKMRLLNFALNNSTDFVLLEIGGTVGDIEGEIFLESIRQLKTDLPHRVFHGHLSYVPYLSWSQEIKTKPTQHSVMLLKKAGLTPDALFLRTDKSIDQKAQEKVSRMCGIVQDLVFEVLTRQPIYRLFLDLEAQKLHKKIQGWFKLKPKETNLTAWQQLITRIEQDKPVVRVGLIAKYIGNDPYISVIEAIKAAGFACGIQVDIVTINAETITDTDLQNIQGIIVPGGFDTRGTEGKIFAARWAREHKIPYLGLCLGMQIMLIEFARSVLRLKDATSSEFDPKTNHAIISLLDSQEKVTKKGASMRLGAYPCTLHAQSRAQKAYGAPVVSERHRHRYEFNNAYREHFEKAGMLFSGIFAEKNLVEIAELKDHPFMLGTQFHPELKSRPLNPHPLFVAWLQAILIHP